jgi:predicted lipoprotein
LGAQRPLITRRQLSQLGPLFAISAAIGCGRRAQKPVLAELVTHVVLGMARELRSESEALHVAVRALSRAPDAERLAAARAAFKRATLAWKRAYAFRAGPFVDSNAFQRAVFWPARPTSIEAVLSAPGPIDERRIEQLGVDARGLYALEYLLFEPASAGALAQLERPSAERARAYAFELSANVRGYANRVQRLLGDGQRFAASFAGAGTRSVDALVAQALDTLEVVAGKFARVERARSENQPWASSVEGYFSGTSLEIVLAIVAGTESIYSGGGRGGLSELVRDVSKPIDEHARAAFREAERQLRAVAMPIEVAALAEPDQLRRAAAAVAELRHVLDVEVQSALAGLVRTENEQDCPMNALSSFTLWSQGHTSVVTPRLGSRARSSIRAAWSVALFGLGLLLLRRLSTLGDWRQAWTKSLELGPSLLLLLALPAVGHFFKMLGWRNLLPRAVRPGLVRSYATFVAAQGVNELGFSVLGEPLKVMVVAREARAAALKAVVVDNLAALAALVALSATLLVGGLAAVLFVLAAVALLLLVAGDRERAVLLAFGAHYLGKSWLVVEIALGLHLLGVAALSAAAPLSLAWLGAAAIGAPVPGQLGVVEAALVQSGAALGLAASSLIALALIRRVRALVWLLLGLLLAARIVHRKRRGDSDASTTIA